jgi:hypothetical protein
MNERCATAWNVCHRTELRGEKIFGSMHIFLASNVNIRILHDANSLQACG